MVKKESQLTIFQDFAVIIAKNRQKQASGQIRLLRSPVDIKKLGIFRGFTVFQNIHPPLVVRANAHMVGDDVQNQGHAVLLDDRQKPFKLLPTADFRIYLPMIDDIIAVAAARPGRQEWRQITM